MNKICKGSQTFGTSCINKCNKVILINNGYFFQPISFMFLDCPGGDFDVTPPVFGVSYIQLPISNACIQQARNTIRSFGFPDQNYITYPMRLPTQCVFGQFRQRPSVSKLFSRFIGLD